MEEVAESRDDNHEGMGMGYVLRYLIAVLSLPDLFIV